MLIIQGTSDSIAHGRDSLLQIPIDEERIQTIPPKRQLFATTLADSFEVSGPSTYHKGESSKLVFHPSNQAGWKFKRKDKANASAINVDIANLVTAKRNLELASETADNNVRMTEHIIAQRLGMNLDNVIIEITSESPPLFDDGSQPIALGILQTGLKEDPNHPLKYYAPAETIAISNARGGVLIFEPPAPGDDSARLQFDVGINFPNAIGKQRIVFDLTPDVFTYASQARTNCSFKDLLLFKTIGKLSPATRDFGYTTKNILIAGKFGYWNRPLMLHNGKSLEAVWHRACEDLIAALSMLPMEGRLVGKIYSYKAGHQLDADFMAALCNRKLLVEV